MGIWIFAFLLLKAVEHIEISVQLSFQRMRLLEINFNVMLLRKCLLMGKQFCAHLETFRFHFLRRR